MINAIIFLTTFVLIINIVIAIIKKDVHSSIGWFLATLNYICLHLNT